MSLLSRLIAAPTPSELADIVAALLVKGRDQALTGVPELPPAPPPEPPPAPQPPAPPVRPAVPLGPVGLGSAAARLPTPAAGPPPVAATPQVGRLGGPTGFGTSAARPHPASPAAQGAPRIPDLYCPGPIRDDEALAREVDDRLIAWAGEVGIYPGHLDAVRSLSVGRLIMLTHPDSDDADRLLAAAKCALAEWATDDHYVDDETLGADPRQLAARLVVANAVVDPAQLPARYLPDLERAVAADPVLRAYRSSLAHLAAYASAAQVRRLRHELAVMFLAYNQEAGWRTGGRTPAVWEYVIHRNENSFLPPMVLIDTVGGYELPQPEFADPRVRRVFTMAGLATVLVNDLYSVAKEQDGPDFNLPKLIAIEERCGLQEAVDRTAGIHDELVHIVEAESAALGPAGSPALPRFLAGVWAWMGGNYEWHRTSPRYHAQQGSPREGVSA